MTVTSMKTKAPPAMAALQTLLGAESAGQDRASSLSNKISTATSVLTFIPTLHPLALEVISNGLLYQCSLVDLSTSQPPPDGQLSVVLSEVWSLLDSLLAHCPLGWSSRLFKWCVGIFGQLSLTSPSPSGLDEALKMWLTSPLLAPVISLLHKCTSIMVSSGYGSECMAILFPVCSQHAPNLNWLLTHVVSLHPQELTSLLLNHTLTCSSTSDLSLTTLTKTFDHLSRTHRSALRHCVVEKVQELVTREQEEGRGGGDRKV